MKFDPGLIEFQSGRIALSKPESLIDAAPRAFISDGPGMEKQLIARLLYASPHHFGWEFMG